jgi:hypothetical protein
MKTSSLPRSSFSPWFVLALGAVLILPGCSDDDDPVTTDAAVATPDAAVAPTVDAGRLDTGATPDAPSVDAPLPGDAPVDQATPTDAGTDTLGTAGDAGGDGALDVLAIAGSWRSNFGFDETITDHAWNDSLVVEFDNATRTAYTQNAATDAFNPRKFNKVLWTTPVGNSFYYCMVDYGQASLAAAKASLKVADAANPDVGGCGGFSWTKLTRR